MKKVKRMIPIMLCLTAVTWMMTSCFGDDTADTITEEQMKECIASMAGTYSGSLVTGVIQNDMLVETDSIGSQLWTADNNKMAFVEFPVAQLAKGITDLDIKAAIEASEETITLEVYYYSFSSVSSPYQFTLAPQTITVNATYKGGSHVLKFPFYQGGYSYGLGTTTKQSIQLVVAGMYEDGTQTPYFTEIALIYNGNKV